MESLNMYGSDGESDSSTSMMQVPRKSTNSEEVDANCEPITMDMSEDSSNGLSDHGDNEERDTNNVKRQYSKSLSTSPATSYSSDSSKGRDEDSKTDSSKCKRYDEDRRDDGRRSKYDRDSRHDDDRDRRRRDDRRDRRRHRDNDRYGAKKHERKRHRSRSRSQSPLARRNSRSYRQKNRSRSRDRSYDRHQRKNSPNRNNGRRRSPYRSRRSRSRTRSRSPRDKPRPKNWKSTSKLKVLEKLGIELKVPPVVVEPPPAGSNPTITNPPSQLTPQMLLQKTMEEQVEKVKTATGIALPAYYNPMAVNPTKYAEQIQKRRLLWGNKDKPANNPPPEEKKVIPAEAKGAGTIWQGATFGGDQDGKMTAKFQRLMGIKNANAAAVPETKKDGTDLIKKQEEMFNSMESQYEVARLATHTHRGVGLGFGTFQPR